MSAAGILAASALLVEHYRSVVGLIIVKQSRYGNKFMDMTIKEYSMKRDVEKKEEEYLIRKLGISG